MKPPSAPYGYLLGCPIVGPLNEHEYRIFDYEAYERLVKEHEHGSIEAATVKPRWWLSLSV